MASAPAPQILTQLGVQYLPGTGTCAIDIAAVINLVQCGFVNINIEEQHQVNVLPDKICVTPSMPTPTPVIPSPLTLSYSTSPSWPTSTVQTSSSRQGLPSSTVTQPQIGLPTSDSDIKLPPNPPSPGGQWPPAPHHHHYVPQPSPPSPVPSPSSSAPVFPPSSPTTSSSPTLMPSPSSSPVPPASPPAPANPMPPMDQAPLPPYCSQTSVEVDMSQITTIDRHDLELHLQLLGVSLGPGLNLDLGLGLGSLLGDDRSTRHLPAAAQQAMVHQYRVRCGASLIRGHAGAVTARASSHAECLNACTADAVGCARDGLARDCLGATYARDGGGEGGDNCWYLVGEEHEFVDVEPQEWVEGYDSFFF